jgi:tape measure domain-containing protein
MAGERVLGSMLVKILGQNAEFDSSIDKSEKKLEDFGKTASKIGGNLTKFITLPLVGIGVAAVQSAADMEQAQLSFETLLGSGEKAKVLLGQLQKFAATTPFEFKDLAQGAKTLLSFGVAAEKIMPITKQLGDIALGDSEKFKSLSLVFGQISSTGRLMGQDLLQLINVGFNPLQEISKRTGESMADLKKRMEAGKISAEEVAAAFKSATSEGGRFFEGTQKLGNSFTGLISTLKDDAATLARSFGELVLPTLKDMVKSVSGIIQSLNDLDPETKKTIVTFGLIAASAGPVVFGVGKVIKIVSDLRDTFGKLSVFLGANPMFLAVTALIGAFVGLIAVVNHFATANQRAIDSSNDLVEKSKQVTDELAQQRQEAADIIGPIDEVTKSQKLNGEQISQLIALYPNLSKFVDLNKASVEELAAALKKENDERVRTSQEALRQQILANRGLIDDTQKTIDRVVKMNRERNGNLDDERELIRQLTDANIKLGAQYDSLERQIQGTNGAFKEQEKASTSAAVQTEKDVFTIKAAEEKLLQQRLTANEGFQRIANDIHASYIGQQMDIQETQRINEEATLAANEGFKRQSEDIAAGFAERNIAAKLAYEEQTAAAKEASDKQKEFQADLQTFATTSWNAIQQIVNSIFDAQLDSYEKDSAEYKKAARDKAIANKAIALVQIAVNTAEGVSKALTLVPPLNFIAAGLVSAAGIAQAAAVIAQPIPALAQGGIVTPRPGGQIVQVAEAGQAEAVIPLDRMNEFIDNRGFGGGAPQSSESFPVSLTIKLSERQLYKGIFQATKNREVLIDASSVVG